jgi:hypothetical protein
MHHYYRWRFVDGNNSALSSFTLDLLAFWASRTGALTDVQITFSGQFVPIPDLAHSQLGQPTFKRRGDWRPTVLSKNRAGESFIFQSDAI